MSEARSAMPLTSRMRGASCLPAAKSSARRFFAWRSRAVLDARIRRRRANQAEISVSRATVDDFRRSAYQPWSRSSVRPAHLQSWGKTNGCAPPPRRGDFHLYSATRRSAHQIVHRGAGTWPCRIRRAPDSRLRTGALEQKLASRP